MHHNIFRAFALCFTLGCSADQISLRNVSTNATMPLTAVQFGRSNVVAVGLGSTVLQCGESLESFEVYSLGPSGQAIEALTYGDGQFLAGAGDRVYASTTGTTWVLKPNLAVLAGRAVSGLAQDPNGGAIVAISKGDQIAFSDSMLSRWRLANLGNSFLEGYRGVAPFGPHGFVACGRKGVVRVSTDSGSNWFAGNGLGRPLGADGVPDLLAVATRGEEILCVGVGGTVVRSQDGGRTWSSTKWSKVTADQVALNAVARTRTGFMAVGDKGLIISSEDGITWTKENSPTSEHLYGVAYGLSGPLSDAIVIVGNSGTLLVGGYPPQAPVKPIGFVSCAGDTNQVLQVEAPAEHVTIDWFDGPIDGEPVASNKPSYPPPADVRNESFVKTFWAQSRDLRHGLTSTNRVPVYWTNFARPTARVGTQLAESVTNYCRGTTNEIRVELLSGRIPWKVIWTDGYEQTVVGTNVTTRLVSPSINTTYTLETVLDDLDRVAGPLCPSETTNELYGSFSVWMNPEPKLTYTYTNALRSIYLGWSGAYALEFSTNASLLSSPQPLWSELTNSRVLGEHWFGPIDLPSGTNDVGFYRLRVCP